jgi:hypothetical protein
MAFAVALLGGCASDPPPTRDGRPVDLDFSPETDADAAIRGLITDLTRRDRQGWPASVARSAPPRSRPLVAILSVRNMTAKSWDTMVIRGKLERALQDAGLAEVVAPEERREVEGVSGRPLAITVEVAEERRALEGGATTVEYTVTITVVDQGSRRGVALVKDTVHKRRDG